MNRMECEGVPRYETKRDPDTPHGPWGVWDSVESKWLHRGCLESWVADIVRDVANDDVLPEETP